MSDNQLRALHTDPSPESQARQRAYPPSAPGSPAFPAKGMHWFAAFAIVTAANLLLSGAIQRVPDSFVLTLQTRHGFTSRDLFNLFYYVPLVLAYALRFLWIRLTYLRYAHAVVWKIYSGLAIFIIPFYAYWQTLREIQAEHLEAFRLLSAWHLVLPLALGLIPFAYFLFAVKKAAKAPPL